jgi:glycerophosphoryl diester phosphodiesterase
MRYRSPALLCAGAVLAASVVAVVGAAPSGALEAAPVPAAAVAAADVVVSAHRGGAAYAPENTMSAFRNAVRLGVDQLEGDVQLTADGRLVLLHDDTLDRTTDCTGVVLDTTSAEIAACDAAHWWSPGPSVTVRDVDADHPLRGTGVCASRSPTSCSPTRATSDPTARR